MPKPKSEVLIQPNRYEQRLRQQVIRSLLADAVYEALGGTPFENVLSGLPRGLSDIRADIERDVPRSNRHAHSALVQQRLAERRSVIAARSGRNSVRLRIKRLADHVNRYIALEERTGRAVGLAAFVSSRIPCFALDQAAAQLGLSREEMWDRFVVAVSRATQTDLWRSYPKVLSEAVQNVDWEELETQEIHRRSEYPNDKKRWSAADEESLRSSFYRLWDAGIEPPIHSFDSGNEMFIALSKELGRTPGAVGQHLIRRHLWSALPGKNKLALEQRRESNTSSPPSR